ncbi:MAG: hypothetical protein EHM55_00930 [Acidobacteria bacterium]|nr:MAG: hypothetical protein EHM55_00930 [Acidobacteriota bacterium]
MGRSRRRPRVGLLARHAPAARAGARAASQSTSAAARRTVHRPGRRVHGCADRAAARAALVGLHHVAGHARPRRRGSRAGQGGHPAGWQARGDRTRCPRPAQTLPGTPECRGASVSAFWRVVWIVAKKDLAIEARSRELLNTTVFFALSCVIVFSVSFVGEGGDGRALGDAAAGILWIAIAFSGTLALGRTFERERYGDTLRALLLAPGARPAVYVGKLVGVVGLLLATEIIIVPLVALLFQARLFDHTLLLAALLGFGTVGFACVGTLFAAMLGRARSRDVLLPILLYPVTIPVMIAGVRGTAALIQPTPQLDMARLWIMLLLSFDVVFLTLSLWTFESVMTE